MMEYFFTIDQLLQFAYNSTKEIVICKSNQLTTEEDHDIFAAYKLLSNVVKRRNEKSEDIKQNEL